MLADAPRELGINFVISRALPEEEYPAEVAGGPIVIVAVTHAGSEAEAEAALAPLAAAAAPVMDVLGERPYLEIQTLYDEAYGWGQRYYAYGPSRTTCGLRRSRRSSTTLSMRSATLGSRPPGRVAPSRMCLTQRPRSPVTTRAFEPSPIPVAGSSGR